VKLSDDDINEFMAIVPFKNHLQNELGLKKYHPVDIKQYSREDFLRYYDEEYDPDSPTQYDRAMAQATQQAAKKHEAEMKKLAATTANLMTTTGWTTGTTSSSGSSSTPSGGTSSGGGIIPPVDPYKADMKALKKAGVPDWKAFALLKHDNDYATWLKGFLNKATIQGFKDHLDPSYMFQALPKKRRSLIYVGDISTPFSPRFYLHLKVLISYVTISLILMRRKFSVNWRNIKLTLSLPHVVDVNVCKRSYMPESIPTKIVKTRL
jgi:hypothetical protein